MNKILSIIWALISVGHWTAYWIYDDPNFQTWALMCLILCYVSEEK